MTQSVNRIVRAPFFFVFFLFSALPLLFIFTWVTIGGWLEGFFRTLGIKSPPSWVPAIAGLFAYIGLGIILPAYLGHSLIGWPGLFVLPLLVHGTVAWFGRW